MGCSRQPLFKLAHSVAIIWQLADASRVAPNGRLEIVATAHVERHGIFVGLYLAEHTQSLFVAERGVEGESATHFAFDVFEIALVLVEALEIYQRPQAAFEEGTQRGQVLLALQDGLEE